MNICHGVDFLPQYHNIWGGAELAANNLINLLQRNGNSQSVLATKPAQEIKESYDFQAIPILEDYFGNIGKLMKMWTFDPLAYIHAIKALKRFKPQVLHLHNFRLMSFSLVTAAKKLGIPVVFSIYDNWALCPSHTLITKSNELCRKYHGLHCITCTYTHKKLSSIYRKTFFNHFLNKIDTFIVLSNTMADVLVDYGIDREKIKFVPLPFSNDVKESDTTDNVEVEPEPDSLLFAGWVSAHKGLKIAVKAMPKIVKKRPNVKLNVIETGCTESYKDEILDFIKKNNLESNINFLGKKSNKEVQQYLQKSELVVVPEQWGIAWPIFLTEAMFAQKPIIASHIGDIPFFINDGVNGHTIAPNDSNSFADKIIHCLENKELAKQYGEVSKQKIEEICNDNNIYEKLIGLYDKLIN